MLQVRLSLQFVGISGMQGRNGFQGSEGRPGPKGMKGDDGATGVIGLPGRCWFICCPVNTGLIFSCFLNFFLKPQTEIEACDFSSTIVNIIVVIF